MQRQITTEMAHRIYDLLVSKLEASEHWRSDFVARVADDCREYRFQGCLGFGGKLYNDHALRVSCYPEDETPEITAKMDAVNEELKLL